MAPRRSTASTYWVCSQCQEWNWANRAQCWGCAQHAADDVDRPSGSGGGRGKSPKRSRAQSRNNRGSRARSQGQPTGGSGLQDEEEDDMDEDSDGGIAELATARRDVRTLSRMPAAQRALVPTFDQDLARVKQRRDALAEAARARLPFSERHRAAEQERDRLASARADAEKAVATAVEQLQELRAKAADATAAERAAEETVRRLVAEEAAEQQREAQRPPVQASVPAGAGDTVLQQMRAAAQQKGPQAVQLLHALLGELGVASGAAAGVAAAAVGGTAAVPQQVPALPLATASFAVARAPEPEVQITSASAGPTGANDPNGSMEARSPPQVRVAPEPRFVLGQAPPGGLLAASPSGPQAFALRPGRVPVDMHTADSSSDGSRSDRTRSSNPGQSKAVRAAARLACSAVGTRDIRGCFRSSSASGPAAADAAVQSAQ